MNRVKQAIQNNKVLSLILLMMAIVIGTIGSEALMPPALLVVVFLFAIALSVKD